ncbi:hypothetical protein [Methanolobus halotolerans]|nr:hypothetical protein [Methanolobus halotolerans]
MGVILVAFLYASFAFILVGSDHATYYTEEGQNLGELNHEGIIQRANDAGYDVQGPFYVNVKAKSATGTYLTDMPYIEERLGDDFLLNHATYYEDEETVMEIMFLDDDMATVMFFNHIRPDPYFSPFEVEHLPQDDWIIERLMAAFGSDRQQAEHDLEELKNAIDSGKQPKMDISRNILPDAIYKDLESMSTDSEFSLTHGEGNTMLSFYAHDLLTGRMSFVVPNQRIVHEKEGVAYTIKMDQLGGVELEIMLSAGEHVPEEKYIDVFREMFKNIGLPEEDIDKFRFQYSPSVW